MPAQHNYSIRSLLYTNFSLTSISVIIPTHNRATSLDEAIQSLLIQTWTDFEIIVVDDGSTDSTPEVVEQIADLRVSYFHCEHSERSVARNLGLTAAEGEYIAFLDDDDLCLPNRLESQARFLNAHSDVDFVGSGFYVREQGGPRQTPWLYEEGGEKLSLRGCLYGQRPSICASMFRRNVLGRMDHWFDPDLIPLEDLDFVLRLALACESRAAWLPEIIYIYKKRHFSSALSIHQAKHDWQKVLNKLFSRPDLPHEVRALRTSVFIFQDVNFACTAFAAGQFRLAQFILLKGLALRPKLKAKGADLVVNYLVKLANLQPGRAKECIKIANDVFDNLPSQLKSWQAFRSQALERVRYSAGISSVYNPA